MTGLPFLTTTVANMRVAVEIAWGADLTDLTGASWIWADVTADVVFDDKIVSTIGRADESQQTQSAAFVCTLNNLSGRYSEGGQSPNWPNVRRNTPVRCRVSADSGSTWFVRYQGNAVGFTPRWDVDTGRWATVTLTGAGPLRLIDQGTLAPKSSFLTYMTSGADSSITAYWPMEDPKTSASFAQAIGTSGNITLMQTIGGLSSSNYVNPVNSSAFSLSSDAAFPCSAPLPTLAIQGADQSTPATLAGTSFYVPLPIAGTTQVTGLFNPTGVKDASWLFTLFDGTAFKHIQRSSPVSKYIGLIYNVGTFATGTGGRIDLQAATGGAGSTIIVNMSSSLTGLDSRPFRWRIAWSGTTYTIGITRIGDSSETVTTATGTTSITLSNYTNAACCPFVYSGANPSNATNGGTIGHIAYHNAVTPPSTDAIAAINSHLSETPSARIARIGNENNIPVTILDSATATNASISDSMGPQYYDTWANLMREAETTGQGVLYDGIGPGLAYATRKYRESAPPAMTLDAATGKIASPFAPVDDDQLNCNQATISQRNGSSITFQDVDGPLGVDAIGLYNDALTVNPSTNNGLSYYAQWLVALGTVEGYRYPTLSFELETAPSLIAPWLAMTPSQRIDVTNIATIRPQHPNYTIKSMLEGYTEEIGQFTWHVAANCDDANPWRVITMAAATGSTADTVCHLDTDSSQLNTSASLGATSISVKTNSGPLWVTSAADADSFPFDISLGGVQVTVTAISGASSPQTFTVSALPQAFTAGAGCPIKVWKPAVLGL